MEKKEAANTGEGKKYAFKTLQLGDTKYKTLLTRKYTERKPWQPVNKKAVVALIPGVIRKIYVKQGKKVKEGEKLVVLEAMKMRNDIISPVDGVVKKIHAKIGKMVSKNEILIEIE